MNRWLLLIALVCIAPFFASAQVASRYSTCPRCSSSGRAVQDCVACAGRKLRPCPDCAPRHERRAYPTLGVPDLDAQLAETAAVMRKLDALRAQLDAVVGWVRTPGRVICPARCSRGKVFLRADECKYCKGKAGFPCPRCKSKGEVKCSTCAGRGRYERACDDCLGIGLLPHPSSIADDQRGNCSWCSGRGVRDCVDCPQAATTKAVCGNCDGAKKLACAKCVGSGDMPCKWCSASGNRSDFLGPKASNDCEDCETTGRVECDACSKGFLSCTTCSGKGIATQACLTCHGLRLRPCSGCNGGRYRHWEVGAEVLAASGQQACAAEFLELARARVDPYYQRRLQDLDDTPADREALEKERVSENARLAKRLEVLQRKQP